MGAQQIQVVVNARNPANDIVIHLLDASNNIIASMDSGTSPEVIVYGPPVADGNYFVRVCVFSGAIAVLPPTEYDGTFITTPVGTDGSPPTVIPYPPQWKYFLNIPTPDISFDPSAMPPGFYPPTTDDRIQACWEAVVSGNPTPGCQLQVGPPKSPHVHPWDTIPSFPASIITFTTMGNNATSWENWFDFLAPTATLHTPVATDRKYFYPWENRWAVSKCNQMEFVPTVGNDINAAIVNLFAQHNRLHDWSYHLGFRENTFNFQVSNLGGQGAQMDPEIGNVQSGAVCCGAPTYLGRDNANQITLQDGIPGISNMYLWQPIAGAFYAPCVDGDYDMSVIGHEYTHGISNRMIAGPAAGYNPAFGSQARAMGESWADITSMEYLYEYFIAPKNGESQFAIGPYVTGNGEKGIRTYNMSRNLQPPGPLSNTRNPLNYSNIGYDIAPFVAGQEHADGEIWSATNFEIRQLLIDRYNQSGFNASDQTLQQKCADGILPPENCPGNRRWMQIVFDSYLLMAVPNVSMVDARDAMLAAEQMRFGSPVNQELLWLGFARRGLGEFASSATDMDQDPIPNFESGFSTENEATIKFQAIATDEGNAQILNARVFVGHYERNSVPIADTDPTTVPDVSGCGNSPPVPCTKNLGDTAKFVQGTYDFLVQANGYGAVRFTATFTEGQMGTITVQMPTNWASTFKGSVASGDGVNQQSLIDDTEETNWASLGAPSKAGK